MVEYYNYLAPIHINGMLRGCGSDWASGMSVQYEDAGDGLGEALGRGGRGADSFLSDHCLVPP